MLDYYFERLLENGKIKAFIAVIVSVVTAHFTSLQDTAKALLLLLIIDLFLGLTIAFIKRNICSKRIYEGLFKFIIYFFVYYSMYYLDLIIFHKQTNYGFANAALVFLGLTEATSILENISELCNLMGWQNPIPQAIIDRLHQKRRDLFGSEEKTKDNLSSSPGDSCKQETSRMEKNKEKI